jgi:Tfp pilus assembly protein PilF
MPCPNSSYWHNLATKDPFYVDSRLKGVYLIARNAMDTARQTQEKLMSNKVFKENYQKASDLYERGKYGESIYFWQQALKEEPHNIHVLSLLALINQTFFGKINEAKVAYQKILYLDATHMEALEALAVIYYDAQQYTEATTLFRRILALYPSEHEAHLYLANIAKALHNATLAIYHYKQVLLHQQRHYAALMGLAEIYQQTDPKQAEGLYHYLLSFKPADTAALLALAKLAGSWQESEHWLKQAHAYDSASPAIMLQLGLLYSRFAHSQLKAEHWLHRALTKAEHSLECNLALAHFYRHNHCDKEAIYYYSEALDIQSTSLEASLGLSDLYLESEHLSDCDAVLNKALLYHPKSAALQRQLARLASANQNFDQSSDHLKKAYQIDPSHIATAHQLAKLYLQQSLYADAESILIEVIEKHPQDSQTQHLLSVLYEEVGMIQKALFWSNNDLGCLDF